MDAITFRYLIGLAVHENLEIHLMDVVTAYLYGSLDNEIYMKVPEGLKISEACSSKSREMYSIRLQKSLYGHMWYNRLSEYLIKQGYINDVISPCIFIKKTTLRFVILAVLISLELQKRFKR